MLADERDKNILVLHIQKNGEDGAPIDYLVSSFYIFSAL